MSGHRDQRDGESRGRTEPTLGDLSDADLDPSVSSRPPVDDGLPQVTIEPRHSRATTAAPSRRARTRPRWLVPLLLVVLVGIVAALWINQAHLRGMVPRTELNDVLGRAQQALQIGHLDGQDGTSARELFEAAVALQPDSETAHDGLRQVGRAELAQADAALSAGELERAAQQAAVARDLLGGGSDIDRLDQAISRARAKKEQPEDLVAQARQALAAGRLTGAQGAAAQYQQILRADPGNAVASHGLDQVGDALALQARKALAAGDSATAGASIEQLAALQPNNGALPALRAAQAQTRKQDSGALDEILRQGQAALRDGRVVGAGTDNAASHFKAALELDPDNAQAKTGLGRVAQALTVQANAAMDAGDAAQATALLDQASTLAPKSADLAAARARLASAPSTPSPPPMPSTMPMDEGEVPSESALVSPQQSAAVARMVQRARAATRRGDIMMPPGDSAYDLYRSALAINGNDADARRGLQGLPAQVEQQFNQSLDAGRLAQAGDKLADLAELAPGDAAQNALSERLAMAWLDQAEQLLGRGDRVGAMQSLDQARKLAPNHPRLRELTARLQGGL